MSKNKLLLIIMDGVGLTEPGKYNALSNAKTPNLDSYFSNYPNTNLACHGNAVGLPKGVMGNSEVGHINIGAGRVVMQDLVRIDSSFEKNTFESIPEFTELIAYLKKSGNALHLMGLLSDAGVHSDIHHLKHILTLLKKNDVKNVFVHAITDGRDTPPNSGLGYLKDIIGFMEREHIGKLATITGRFYAMDRDKRWDRVQVAYEALLEGKGDKTKDPLASVQSLYDEGITDEFLTPIIVEENSRMSENDAVLTLNFRADRMREIASALNFDNFDGFKRQTFVKLNYLTMTRYQESFPFKVLFKDQKLTNIFGEIISNSKMTQLRIAETEKYAHVTYFFNGGDEKQYEGEDRVFVNSPKVKTYDLKPEMSAPEVTDKLLEAIDNDLYDVIILNFANGDMVGHTGVLEAVIKALETIDEKIGILVNSFQEKGGTVLITADHGNSEQMWDFENNQPHTQHSLNPVPFIVISKDKHITLNSGALSDIAPTMLDILNLEKPEDMTGNSLIVKS